MIVEKSESLEIITLVDNYVDLLLPDSGVVTRPPLSRDGTVPSTTLLAEHGLSLLIRTYSHGKRHTVLFDTGYSRIALFNNLNLLNIDIGEIEAIVISHAHMDHTGGLMDMINRINQPIPLVVHPDVFMYPRYIEIDGKQILFPQTIKKDELKKTKVQIVESRQPTMLADGTIMVTGYVERTTDFERGMPNVFLQRNGKTEKDEIQDDQSLIINLGDKGLVVISGCSHSGIINTVRHAQKITGIRDVHAVIGGFHLSGAFFELIIEDTINEMKRFSPKVLVPMHCTGWAATIRFFREFPSSFILNSVGSKITLE